MAGRAPLLQRLNFLKRQIAYSEGMRVKETTETAIKMALKNKRSKGQTILHSDRGFQYCNPGFVEQNKKNKICPSMTENSDP